MTAGLRTVIVAPMTSGGRTASFRPRVEFKGTSGLVLLDQVRAVDKKRLLNRMGRLDDKVLVEALIMLQWIFSPPAPLTK